MTTQSTAQQSNTPAYEALIIKESGYATKIGAAWLSKSGKAINIVLDCIPVDGRFTLCAPQQKSKA